MNRIKELRKQRKITQKALADIFGVSVRTIQKWEHGDTAIKAVKTKKLADYAIWLIGFIGAIIVGILGRKRGNNSFETQSEPLNLDSGLMNAKKLNRKEGRENDEQ